MTKREAIDKKFCNYHICGKEATLSQCPHCEAYYCSEHIKPCNPWTGDPFKKPPYQILQEKNAHPCTDYAEYQKEKQKEETKKTLETLDNMTGRNPKIIDKKPVETGVFIIENSKKRNWFQKLLSKIFKNP